MKQPSCVIWGLTKNNSSFKRQMKGMKSRFECFNNSPMNLTGLHNQSSDANTLGLGVARLPSKSGKSFKRSFELRVAHKQYNKTAKVAKNAAAGTNFSVQSIKTTKRAAAVVKGLTFANDAKKQVLLKRLHKLHKASRDLTVQSK